MATSTPIDYPVCLRLEGRRVLLVGGGAVAEGRALALLEAGARLHLIAPDVTDTLQRLAAEGRLDWERRAYASGDVRGHALVLAATDEPAVNQHLTAEARELGLWVNTADEPELCDFTLPSVERRGPITVAVSTAGQAPALARHLRRELGAQVAPHHVWLARLSGWLRRRLPRGPRRQRLLKQLVEGEPGALLARGERGAAVARLRSELKTFKSSGEFT
ncbi:bifunctional precorrin-2 dehydrogenase/sirohydrochlorin ferrochelatase [Myxococcus sp. CA051A]|uniref:precorrin-2 dehydrogenase n=1 Tax=Myxococcus llanfairpwllgwyngyllgogerychwyrndrobwllllantysiliogogogochensis TaxID=2590453 RepID=A0A540WXM0_9BACT|nr:MULTISPECIES: bifunctional precorrin-2 dehydrogenase/sirohydrochlorin ferrochelatase [Myxococcus]NTX08649.1 bifunctional precorrin-2 dehydrogenase/sirohydrochlorin ferrochelatase [Myxococcus sp. CA040A]NTX66320.1 bifunctional precorrin-2 dehydrogenase/sirohydrochlorin ferrochelatase [Myxococcus sp. CA051A]TQF13680.1 bifunctional precorrin-2 dehydrogenase/sirohydrochlorin ferrochelatase [Myxococcus llanfairpwllgwyngyllgogerychwyrndrobwllllantysiliogogogochensis]